MHIKSRLGGIAVLATLAGAPLQAQTSVGAGVVVHSGGTTVRGHVNTGPEPAPVVVREPAREVVVVERMQVPRGRANGWWRKQGYREVRVYSDGNRYYPHRMDRRPLTEIVVYERHGRYYRWDDRDDHRDDHRDHDHEHGHKGKGHHGDD